MVGVGILKKDNFMEKILMGMGFISVLCVLLLSFIDFTKWLIYYLPEVIVLGVSTAMLIGFSYLVGCIIV